jgi:CheY-like chemotaxis protein
MPTVLVIEDDDEMRQTICRALRRVGFDTVEAANGRDGIQLATSHQPALVITDIGMPGQDGIETIVELRRTGAGPLIIAMSGMTGRAGFDPLRDANARRRRGPGQTLRTRRPARHRP